MANLSPIVVAIVDDEEQIRRALRRLLSSAGYVVKLFATGGEFLGSLAASRPACLILDLHMPLMDGFVILDRLKQAGAAVPVLVITGFDTPQSRERAIASGAAAYLRKPIDEQQLINAIQEATR